MNGEKKAPLRILLVSYPKIVFLYPTFVISLAAAIYLSVARPPLDTTSTEAIVLSVVFLGVWVTNLVVLAFDFPRTSSLSVFLLFIAAAMGGVLLSCAEARVSPVRCRYAQRIPPLGQRKLLLDFFNQPGFGYAGSNYRGPIRLLGSSAERTTAPPGALG